MINHFLGNATITICSAALKEHHVRVSTSIRALPAGWESPSQNGRLKLVLISFNAVFNNSHVSAMSQATSTLIRCPSTLLFISLASRLLLSFRRCWPRFSLKTLGPHFSLDDQKQSFQTKRSSMDVASDHFNVAFQSLMVLFRVLSALVMVLWREIVTNLPPTHFLPSYLVDLSGQFRQSTEKEPRPLTDIQSQTMKIQPVTRQHPPTVFYFDL